MAGIRERDKRGGGRFWIRWPMAILYHVCSMFAICSFPAFGPRCAFPRCGQEVGLEAPQRTRSLPRHWNHQRSSRRRKREYGRPLRLRKHTEMTRRAGFAYSELWADISFSNARGWAPTCSIGFRRPRRTSPMPMRPSSASPVHGFISSTSKPANFSARNDAASGSVPGRTQARAFARFRGTESAAVRNRIGDGG